jgi:hypothetical protein
LEEGNWAETVLGGAWWVIWEVKSFSYLLQRQKTVINQTKWKELCLMVAINTGDIDFP